LQGQCNPQVALAVAQDYDLFVVAAFLGAKRSITQKAVREDQERLSRQRSSLLGPNVREGKRAGSLTRIS
jgi:hypothetical protein